MVMDEWIEHVPATDREVVGQLWRSHHEVLLRYLRARGSTEPEALAAEVWIAVAASLHRFSGDSNAFRRWLFTIARRHQIDATRKRVREPLARSVRAAGFPAPPTARSPRRPRRAVGRPTSSAPGARRVRTTTSMSPLR
jgi:DNA-directed RNA polymerase specialized sigma24 family protein